MFGGGVDAGVERRVEQVAAEDGAGTDDDEELCGATARKAQESVRCAERGHAHIVAATRHNRRMILPEPRDRFRGRLPKRWVAIDFETTGIWSRDPDVAVIEIGLITFEGDREIAAWSTLVKSGTPVSDFIADLTGITQAMVDADGIDVDEAGDALAERLAGAELVIAHNMAFDENIVGAELLRAQLPNALPKKPRLCTMQSATDFCRLPGPYGFKWPTLTELHQKLFGEGVSGAHQALVDVRACARCYFQLRERGVMT